MSTTTCDPVLGDPAAMATADVLRAASGGDPAAWAELIHRYTPVVRARMRRFPLQESDRNDIAQIAWMRLAENVGRLHTPEHVGGWLATVVTRECTALCGREGRTTAMTDWAAAALVSPVTGPEEAAVDADLARLLWAAVDRLPPARRDLVRALFAQDTRPYAEISRLTGIPVGGIGPTRGRAIEQLRAMLTPELLAS